MLYWGDLHLQLGPPFHFEFNRRIWSPTDNFIRRTISYGLGHNRSVLIQGRKVVFSMLRVPQTSVEWKKALIAIKKDYLERKYRSCLKQCLDLLDGAKVAVSPHHSSSPIARCSLRVLANRASCAPNLSSLLRRQHP